MRRQGRGTQVRAHFGGGNGAVDAPCKRMGRSSWILQALWMVSCAVAWRRRTKRTSRRTRGAWKRPRWRTNASLHDHEAKEKEKGRKPTTKQTRYEEKGGRRNVHRRNRRGREEGGNSCEMHVQSWRNGSSPCWTKKEGKPPCASSWKSIVSHTDPLCDSPTIMAWKMRRNCYGPCRARIRKVDLETHWWLVRPKQILCGNASSS